MSGDNNDQERPIGLLKGKATLPDDFDSMFSDEIEAMFKGMFEEEKTRC